MSNPCGKRCALREGSSECCRTKVQPVRMCLACKLRPAGDKYSDNALLCGICYYDL